VYGQSQGARFGGPAGEESALWARFTVENRAALIEKYQPLVYHILGQLPQVPSEERVDVISEGTLALIEAVDAFDSGRGVKFITFAYLKVKGRMLDYLRRRKPFVSLDGAAEFSAYTRIIGFSDRRPIQQTLSSLRLAEELLRLLTPAEERILRLVYQRGYSQDEVARALACSRANVSILHKRALKRMRKIVSSKAAWRLAFEP
jgi:RNA polymerase sporulation-specific sigma factor